MEKNRKIEKPEENRQKRKSRSRSRGRFNRCLAVTALAAAISLGVCAAVAVCGFPAPVQAWIDIQPDKRARSGTLHAGGGQEVAEGDFWLVMNQLPTMEEGSRECSIEYENPATNHYSARISLYGEDGKLLGNTRRVDPGNYVEKIQLKKLPPGEHPVTVRVELFEEQAPAGVMSIDIMLRVMKERL